MIRRGDTMEHFNSSEARVAQDKYCDREGYPQFAPRDGKFSINYLPISWWKSRNIPIW